MSAEERKEGIFESFEQLKPIEQNEVLKHLYEVLIRKRKELIIMKKRDIMDLEAHQEQLERVFRSLTGQEEAQHAEAVH